MKKIAKYLWLYLKDWKNLLAHTLVGVLILCVAFFMPVEPIFRVVLLFAIIAFNILRMRIAKKRKA